MLGQLERYFKQMIVDRDDYVSSAALTSSLSLLNRVPATVDTISRWVGELQTVLTSRSSMVQFHALALLKAIRKHDRLAVSKVVQQLIRGGPGSGMKSPLGICLLVRYVHSLLLAEPASAAQASSGGVPSQYQIYFEFLESCMRHKNEMVVLEAARAVCALPNVTARDLSPAITMLHMFITSPKPSLRFAAVRTLHKLAAVHPSVVAKCNEDLEALISDANRAISTLAVTTLLKTGSEASVDRLMRQIGTFLADVGSDELKVTVVTAIHELALRVPSKFKVILSFLANALREEGGFDFKRSVLDAVMSIMEMVPEAMNEGLFHLCEFIEDCEFTSLATRVLHLLGDQGPNSPHPSAFIRFIYNRVILENAPVRASAVTALAKFATRVEELRPSIIPLLQRSLDDDDDDVRDRATMYLSMLGASTGGVAVEPGVSKSITSGRLPLPVAALQKALVLYQLRPTTGPFSFDALPHVEVPASAGSVSGEYGYASEVKASESAGGRKAGRARLETTAESSGAGATASGGAGSSSLGSAPAPASAGAAEALYKVPEFASFGPLFRSSRPLALTEDELEYLVSVTKHVFGEHIVFQFTIRNTVSEVILDRAAVAMSPSDSAVWRHVVTIAAQKVREGTPATAFVAFQRSPEAGAGSSGSFACELRFTSREVDPATGEVVGDATPESFPLDSVDITPADYVNPTAVSDFRSSWEAVGRGNEVLEDFALPIKSVHEAIASVIDALGVAACEGTGAVKPGVARHNAFLSGVFLGGAKVLVRMQVTLEGAVVGSDGAVLPPTGPAGGVILKIGIRSDVPDVAQLLMECIS